MQVSQSDSQWLYFTLARGGGFSPLDPPKLPPFSDEKKGTFHHFQLV